MKTPDELYDQIDELIFNLEEAKRPDLAQKLRNLRDNEFPSFRIAVIDAEDGSGAIYEVVSGSDPEEFTREEIEKTGFIVCTFCAHKTSEQP